MLVAGRVPRIPGEVLALIAALQLREPDLTQLESLDDQAWHRLLGFSDRAHLTLPLSQIPGRPFPQWVTERLTTNVPDNSKRFERVKQTFQEAAGALADASVEFILFKGFTQAPEFVPNPWLRAQSDLDFYCPPSMISAAQRALEAIGYGAETTSGMNLADHVPALVRRGDWEWRGNPFDPDMPLSIELHFCFRNENLLFFPLPSAAAFWEHRTLRHIEGMPIPCLSPIDHLGYISLHILRNVLRGDWIIHHVQELAWFLHSHANDDTFWKEWCDTHEDNMRACEAIAFRYAQAWFDCRIHSEPQKEVDQLPLPQKNWLSQLGGSALEGMFHEQRDGIWLNWTFLQSRRGKVLLSRRSLLRAIPTLNACQVILKNRQLRHPVGLNPYSRYVRFLVARIALLLRTLVRGFRWRFSLNPLPRAFWMFFGTSCFLNLGLSIFFFLLNLVLLNRGFSPKPLGFLTGAMCIGNIAGSLPAGKLAQHWGVRPVLAASILSATLVSAARAVLFSFEAQFVLALLSGVALSAWAVCLSPTVARLSDESSRPRAFSIIFSLGIGIAAVGAYIGGHLPDWFANHHLEFLALKPDQVVLLLASGLTSFGLLPLRYLSLGALSPPRPKIVRSAFLVRFLPAIAAWSVVTGSFSPLANIYFAQHLHMSIPLFDLADNSTGQRSGGTNPPQ